MKQIQNLDNALDNLRNDAMTLQNFEEYFVETDKTRGEVPIKIIHHILNKNPTDSMHILFTGFRGCGKSTELLRLQRMLDNFMVVNFSIKHELDSNNFTHTELLIATMKKLFEKAIEEKLDIDEKYLEPIENWKIVKNLEESNNEAYSAEIETGGSIGAKLPWLFEIFTKLTAKAKFENNFRETLKREVQPIVSELISSSNILIREIKNALEKKNKGLLIIIEDLDKIDIALGEELFLKYSERLVSLNANTIYTFPITLRSHEQAQAIQSKFTELYELPVIKTHDRNGNPMEEGFALMRSIIEKRLDLDLFESQEILDNFIRYSGGVLWDLLRFLRDAISQSLVWEHEKIIDNDWQRAYYSAKKNYRAMIAERVRNGQVIKVDEYYEAMVKLAKSKDKQPDNTPAVMDLRQNLCVLGYNTEGWYGVHPIMIDILIEKKLLDESFRVR